MCPHASCRVLKLLKADFLGNLDRRFGTRAFLPFLTLIGRLVGFLKIIRFAFFIGADAFNRFQLHQKQAHVHQRHALLIHIVLVLPLKWAHTQHMSP